MSMNASPDFEVFLPSEVDSKSLGTKLARILRPGDVIALYGELGAGKTTLARGLIQSLLGDETEVPSPTYTLVQTYELPECSLWHFDLYRVNTPSELFELGFEDALQDIAIIEWPDHAGDLLPSDRLSLRILFEGSSRRAVLSSQNAEWVKRLDEHFDRSGPKR
ncbi:MAG: tRNA (adenosine(37)-N6)-threonylcarbamoyltransferase complex ATPase subunit type 1 TsaE [Ponticaulis sp.]|nr:tRNA (adenosine(37)-N6)-threonylcarbamoyltransferase complex ATPase subunit type 1 TsaE [Ponticaulis sp.]|tara:strand:- start:49227 stop:49718 length:492 start_codon:yes stop_codon:yes gene_type:complete